MGNPVKTEGVPTAAGTYRHRLWQLIDPLWAWCFAALAPVAGYWLIPRLIRAVGRGGQIETVEWALYMSMLTFFPAGTALVVLMARSERWRGAARIVQGAIVAAALAGAFAYAVQGNVPAVALALLLGTGTAFATRAARSMTTTAMENLPFVVALSLVGAFGWMAASGMVFWHGAISWNLTRIQGILAIAFAVAITIRGLPKPTGGADHAWTHGPSLFERGTAILAIAVLVIFSFRTTPIVELYHWGFYVGPLDGMRQGGALLRETPAQYGFLSMLLPNMLPGNSWQSFWAFQGIVFSVATVVMFLGLRRLRGGTGNVLFAAALTFCTMFFRPRSDTLIIPTQMTPSGGPVRFLWCLLPLAFLLFTWERWAKEERQSGLDDKRFAFIGHAIWILAVTWSFETGVYATAIWFPAYGVHLLQRVARDRDSGRTTGEALRRLLNGIAMPLILLGLVVAFIYAVYTVVVGQAPDLMGYIEYGLLYSRGFGALPVDITGNVWFLLLIFCIATSAVATLVIRSPRDPSLIIAAGVWGCVWSVSSYFVGRSHPVNILSITPVILFAMAVLLVTFKRDTAPELLRRYALVALVPIFAMPIAINVGHPGFLKLALTPQLPPSRFTEQVDLMPLELETLLRSVGAKPSDSYVRVVDGRLMLPAWRNPGGDRIVSDRNWLPKPYEIIGSLPAERRQTYIDRAAPVPGWLIHHESDTIKRFGEHFAQILRTHEAEARAERAGWIVFRMVPRSPKF